MPHPPCHSLAPQLIHLYELTHLSFSNFHLFFIIFFFAPFDENASLTELHKPHFTATSTLT